MNQTTKKLEAILAIALDLTTSLAEEDRNDRLLDAVRRAIPCDGAALLRNEGDSLVPVAGHGLVPEALARPYRIAEHPRLEIISRSEKPVLFPPDSALPDPFDGMLAADPSALGAVHACLGCPLRLDGEFIGVLTADALDPTAFGELDGPFLASLGALAGAAMRTSRLIDALEKSTARLGLVARDLMRESGESRGAELIGTSPPMKRLRSEIELVARSNLTVLVTGETGTGKELVARAVHSLSDRREHPLIYVNCAALPEALAESELFGHVRGAFTGADRDRPGKFEVADGGTLFLDEIGELPGSVQPTLLRALQGGEIQRVGSDSPVRVDVRVVAATNRDLLREVEEKRFRSDLYHRLAEYPLVVPPLRDRPGDVPVLAGQFLDLARRRHGLHAARLTEAAREALSAYDWPGNVREFENVLNRAVLRRAGGSSGRATVVLSPSDLGPEFGGEGTRRPAGNPAPFTTPREIPLAEALDEVRRELITHAVRESGGNWSGAARRLGMNRGNLHRLAVRLGLKG